MKFSTTLSAVMLLSPLVGFAAGMPPTEESVCGGLTGKAFGLCFAYYEAMGCGSTDPKASAEACVIMGLKLADATDGSFPIPECPCFTAEYLSNINQALYHMGGNSGVCGYTGFEVNNGIMITDTFHAPDRDYFVSAYQNPSTGEYYCQDLPNSFTGVLNKWPPQNTLIDEATHSVCVQLLLEQCEFLFISQDLFHYSQILTDPLGEVVTSWCYNEVAGTAVTCDDDNVCTDDSCAIEGCQYSYNTNPCDDSLDCTENDACSQGTCSGTLIPGYGIDENGACYELEPEVSVNEIACTSWDSAGNCLACRCGWSLVNGVCQVPDCWTGEVAPTTTCTTAEDRSGDCQGKHFCLEEMQLIADSDNRGGPFGCATFSGSGTFASNADSALWAALFAPGSDYDITCGNVATGDSCSNVWLAGAGRMTCPNANAALNCKTPPRIYPTWTGTLHCEDINTCCHHIVYDLAMEPDTSVTLPPCDPANPVGPCCGTASCPCSRRN